MTLKDLKDKIPPLTSSSFFFTLFICIVIISLNIATINGLGFLDKYEVEVYENLRFFLYNFSYHLMGFVLTISFFRRSLRYNKYLRGVSLLLPFYYSYEMIAMIITAFAGDKGEKVIIVSTTVGVMLVLLSLIYLLNVYLKNTVEKLTSENDYLNRFFSVTSKNLDEVIEKGQKLSTISSYAYLTTNNGMDSSRSLGQSGQMTEEAFEEIYHWLKRSKEIGKINIEDHTEMLGQLEYMQRMYKGAESNINKPVE